jgi:biopolymer transport protein ExbB
MSEGFQSIWSYWTAGGPLLAPIGLVCFGIWALFLRSRGHLARAVAEGEAVKRALDGGGMGTMPGDLAAGLAELPGGVAAMVRASLADVLGGAAPRAAFAVREADCLGHAGRDLVALAALTAAAPLLGLLGTVAGMIETFDAVAAAGGSTGARVADGIRQALVTTQFGLVVAVPGVFGLARLQRMVRHAEVVMAECRSRVLQALEPMAEGAQA